MKKNPTLNSVVSVSGHDALADSTAEADPLEDSSDILKDTRSTFFTPDSPTDEPIIISDKSEEEEEVKKDKDTKDTSVLPPPSPKSTRIQELMAQPSKLLASHDFASCLPTELKEIPSKITRLSGEIKELTQHIKDMEIELLVDLIEIPTKNIQWKLPAKFATMVDNAIDAASMKVPLAGQATALPYEGEKNTKDAGTNLKDELIDLLGKDVMTQYYTKMLLFDKYCYKMLKRKKNPKITNCKVLIKKGPIILKIYRKDGSDDVILNLTVIYI
ncbi:hypothetical protein Tco_1001858 [Tanacetum coccineum]